jgi:peptidoglycan/xylan/chitin deacetylase (PgdA/CDA1 family)
MKPYFYKLINQFLPIEYSRDTKNTIYLTFDDGPTNNTLKILDVLNKYNANATFFILGKRIEDKEHILEKISNQGHLLANHSFNHYDMSKLSYQEIIEEFKLCDDVINKYSASNVIRPPYGRISINLVRYARKFKKNITLWSKDSQDYSANSINDIKCNIQTVNSGDIILFHDEFNLTSSFLEQLIPQYIEQGFSFSAL